MFHSVQLVLNQVLMVLFPIWFYHLFLREEGFSKNILKPKLLIVLSVSLILSLIYSVHYSDSYIYDLKLVPIIIAFLYGSNVTGIIILMIAMLYRIVFQDGSPVITVINFAIASGILYFIARKFKIYSVYTKVTTISILYILITITRVLWIVFGNHSEDIGLVIVFSLLTWITLLSIVFIFENLNKQIELENKALRAEKLDVVGQLAASVAHEVRNPMTSVRGFLQLMKNDENLNESQKRHINLSIEELDHSQAIITEYLSLAKPSNLELKNIDLKIDLENIIELMKSYTNYQTISITSQLEDSLHVKGNSSEIKQVFVNIMKNSIEAIGSNGQVKVRAYKNREEIIVEIEDNGPGMSKTQLKYLGTPFYSTKDKGTGVGLTVSYKIINSMKGNITVESVQGKGTKFTIQLPNSLADM